MATKYPSYPFEQLTQPIISSYESEEAYQRARGAEYEARAKRLRQMYSQPPMAVSAWQKAMQVAPPAGKMAKVLKPKVSKRKVPKAPKVLTPFFDTREYPWMHLWGDPETSPLRTAMPQIEAHDDDYFGTPVNAAPMKRVGARPVESAPEPDAPTFLMGIEFEGMVRETSYPSLQDALYDLAGDDDNGDPVIQFGVDSSVKNIPEAFTPIEIRTSVMSLDEGLILFDQILCVLYLASEVGDFKTNQTCGLHLNVSEQTIFDDGDQLDLYLELLTRFDELEVLRRFGREGNRYCLSFWGGQQPDVSLAEQLYSAMKGRERKAAAAGNARASRESKYLACSLRDSPRHDSYEGPAEDAQRIEFRCIGNESYHLRFEDLALSVNHMLEATREAYEATVAALA